ncbi:MAG: phosphotransferase [Polyangiaceae bacterium]|nr:phosphotransferase [Polyangiaceae bacterium]
MDAGFRAALGASIGTAIRSVTAASGGDVATAYGADLADGSRVFVKTHASLAPDAFQREAEGLAWLAETKTVHVPRVLAVGAHDGRGFLVLEQIETSRAGPHPSDEERLGRELAALHRSGAPSFGLWTSNYLALLPQDNAETTDWATFYRTRRLEPLVERARARGLCPARVAQGFDRLYAVLVDRVGPAEPPARLHGDLWAGNRILDPTGTSWVIDPCVYGGHREIDLAMMRLFGGFSSGVFQAYDEAFPLAEGHAERVALYQLYPLLAHLVLFGGGYLGEVEAALAQTL